MIRKVELIIPRRKLVPIYDSIVLATAGRRFGKAYKRIAEQSRHIPLSTSRSTLKALFTNITFSTTMSSSPKIKVGFVGLSSAAGWASEALAPSLLVPSVREKYDIVAVSTTSEATAKASAEKYSETIGHPLKTYYGDVFQIASDPDVDLVAVAVKAPYHKEIVLKVIEAKKDFFIEWPAGSSTKETEEIAEAARKQGVRSLVGLQGRHAAVIDKVGRRVDSKIGEADFRLVQVKEILASGVIGTVRSTNVVSPYITSAVNNRPINSFL